MIATIERDTIEDAITAADSARPDDPFVSVDAALIGEVTWDNVVTAIHEAGHMTVSRLFGCVGVTGSIDPAVASSHTMMLEHKIAQGNRDRMTVLAGGIAAIRLWNPHEWDGGGEIQADESKQVKCDRHEMLNRARVLHGLFATDDQLRDEIDQAIERADAMLRPAWLHVVELAECLIRTHAALAAITPLTDTYADSRLPEL